MFEGKEIQVLTASATILGVFVLVRWLRQNGTNGKRYPPSIPILPLLRSGFRGGMTVIPEHFRKVAEELGPIFALNVGKDMVVVLNGYEAIVNALVKQSDVFSDRVALYNEKGVINPELKGIIYCHYNDLFKKNNKMCFAILKEFGFGQSRVTETRILLEVEKLTEEILRRDGRPFDPKWSYPFATASVVLSILFGPNFLKSLPKEHANIVKSCVICIENMDLTLNFAPFLRFLPAYRKKVDGLRSSSDSLLKSIETAIEFVKATNTEATFVGRYLEVEGKDYNHQDLLFLIRDLCFAGSETVATTTLWATLELANHPEIQKRLHREITEVVPAGRHPSLDDKPRLTYAEAVILEVWRRHTIAPFLVPHSTRRDTKLMDYDIPKAAMVIANVHSAHMDPKFWKDPENFRPERFLDSDNKLINTDKQIGFGLGKRACLGEILGRQSAFLFLTSLIQRFEIRPPEGQDSIVVGEVTGSTTQPMEYEVRMIPREKRA